MFVLTTTPRHRPAGGLWFVIPDELQHKVVPYLQSLLPTCVDTTTRKHYRYNVLSKRAIAAVADDYSKPVFVRSMGKGTFEIYSNWGKWRTNSGALATFHLESVKAELIAALEAFEIPAK